MYEIKNEHVNMDEESRKLMILPILDLNWNESRPVRTKL